MSVFSFEEIKETDPAPRALPDCAALKDELSSRALDEARVGLQQSVHQIRYHAPSNGGRGWFGGGVQYASSAESDSSASLDESGGVMPQVTGTNNQEAGADESDLVKTDGTWTYVFSNGILYILHSADVGLIEKHWIMPFPGEQAGEILLERRDPLDPNDDRLILILQSQGTGERQVYGLDQAGRSRATGSMTHIVVVSLADRSDPQVEHEMWIEGQPIGGRLVDGTSYVVVHSYAAEIGLRTAAYPQANELEERGLSEKKMQRLRERQQVAVLQDIAREADEENQARLANMSVKDHLPVVLETRGIGKAIFHAGIDDDTCSRVLTPSSSTGRSMTTIVAIASDADPKSTSVLQVAGTPPILYASEQDLVLASPSVDLWWSSVQETLEITTDLHWFRLDGLDVKPHASGLVVGNVMDSFGIDVEGDELRVATMIQAPQFGIATSLAVFGAKAGVLVPGGIVAGIAPGERLYSARFTSDRAYLVTFRQTDPLWVIDLSVIPTIEGELHIPGVSTYIHPVNDTTLLTVGYGPSDGGQGLNMESLDVSLFDISDLKDPKRVDVLALAPPGGGGFSGAIDEHRSFTYWAAVDRLAVPLTTGAYSETRRAQLSLVDVDLEEQTLSLQGAVTQERLGEKVSTMGLEIQRSFFLGYPEEGDVSVYAVSAAGVTSHDLETLESQGGVLFRLPE